MTRPVRNVDLTTKTARRKLSARRSAYFCSIGGLHLGYRRLRENTAGTWIVRVYVGEQRYREQSIGAADDYLTADKIKVLSFEQACAKANEIHQAKSLQEKSDDKPSTVDDALDQYLSYIRSHRKSILTTESTVEALIRPALGRIALADLTTKRLQEYINELATTPRRKITKKGEKQRYQAWHDDDEAKRKRKASANETFGMLRAALNHAYRLEMVESDQAWRRVKRFKGAHKPRSRFLTIEECQRLIAVCEPRFRALVRGALFTGARYSELCRLVAADFHVDTGTVEIKVSKSGKPRFVELTEQGVEFFGRRCEKLKPDDFIFLRGGRDPWARGNQQHHMKVACERAGITGASFHTLRHSWASLAVMSGVPLKVAATNLGHADTSMIERIYGHLAPNYIREQIRSRGPRFDFEVMK